MDSRYYKEHSEKLDRDMEYKVFGDAGKICLAFPPQGGRFWDFENFGMVDTVKPWVEAGRLQVVLVDGIDNESWSGTGDEHARAVQQERWFSYVVDELLPTLKGRNGEFDKAMTTGCSMGGLHAANFFLRRPDLFDATICLSGVYNADFFYPGYTDPLVYDNSPIDYLANMPEDHKYMDLYRKSDIILCVGQGAWEDNLLASTRRLEAILSQKGIPAWVDYWGFDVAHDWPWWKKQLPYFMGYVLGDPNAPAAKLPGDVDPSADVADASPAKDSAPAVKKPAAAKKVAAKPAAAKKAPAAKKSSTKKAVAKKPTPKKK